MFRDNGSVTAFSASGLNDGASALVLCSREAIAKYNLTPIAVIRGFADAEQVAFCVVVFR